MMGTGMRLYAGVDTDGRVKLFTMDSGIPRIVTHEKWLDVTHEIEGYVPGEMLLVELSREEKLKPPRIQVRGVTVSYPDWQLPGKGPDPARFDHADVNLQIFGTPSDLKFILGLREFDELARVMPDRLRIFDVAPDKRTCPAKFEGETILDRLCSLGYMTRVHKEEIEGFMQSSPDTCGAA